MATDQQKKIANDCWKTGSEAVNKQNWDYAVTMFQKSIEMLPGNLVYRQSLRGAQFRKYDNNKKGKGLWAKTTLMSIRSKMAKARSKEDWAELDRLAEQGLALNPWDAGMNIALAEACAAQGFNEIAVFAYTLACGSDGEPENRKYLSAMASFLSDIEKYDEAVIIWSRIQKLDPNDKEARKMMTSLQANKMMDRGGYDEANTTRDVMPDCEVDKRIHRGQKDLSEGKITGPGQSAEDDLLREIRKNPEDYNLQLKLAELYRKNNEVERAIVALKKANEIAEGDSHIEEMIEDLELIALKKEVEKTVQTANETKGDRTELIAKAKELKKQLIKKDLVVTQKRLDLYPQDMQVKLKLARLYIKVDKTREAIPLLQRAIGDARVEIEATVLLARCFLKDQRGKQALRQYKKVQPKLQFHEHPEFFKEMYYYMGRLYQQAGDSEQAEECYGEVLAVDYDYKDTRKRLDSFE